MMQKQRFFQKSEKQNTCNNQEASKQVIPLETPDGLKMANLITKEIRMIPFLDEHILFDWDSFSENIKKDQLHNLSFQVFMADGSKLLFRGQYEAILQIYNYCVGKYIFKRGNTYRNIQKIQEDENYEIRIVSKLCNSEKYFEKVILNDISQPSNEIQELNNTIDVLSILPEEIQIILELNRINTKHIFKVDSVLFDGTYYSYTYKKEKDFIDLIQYYNQNQINKQSFLIKLAQQILTLLVILEDSQIVMPNIHHKSIYVNPQNNEIQILAYHLAFHTDSLKLKRKGAILGYAPPEYFNPTSQVTTKANVSQVGTLLYFLLFNHTPYGSDTQVIIQNTLKGEIDLKPLQQENSFISKFIQSLLETNQIKRPTAAELLQHKVFSNLAPHKLYYPNQQDPLEILQTEELKTFQKISNIQQINRIQSEIFKN